MKKIGIAALLVWLTMTAFGSGVYVGRDENRAARDAAVEIDMALRIYRNVEKEFGVAQFDGTEYKNVKGTIHLAKDMDLAIFDDGGIKTIRAYK